MSKTILNNVRNSMSSVSAAGQSAISSHQQQAANNAQAIKNRNDPGRFFGDGVIFKAKLIGVLEVGEARGDRMCQEALQDLKTAIRAAGEHKQRITIHVTIDGLRLRDEKTSDCLYHHPVHKISFIAQDMTDSRAFGYIFGSPDSGHRFFGIKTDKAASQVVLAMRDLFQVVFELKKKEIELARQQIQSKTSHHEILPLSLNIKASMNNGSVTALTSSKINNTDGAKAKTSPESVADLVDLEQELNCLQRGINQMERITPNEPTPIPTKSFTEDDPFGDSFTNVVPSAYSILPPPESSSTRSSRHSKPVKPPETIPTLSNLLTSAPINNSTSSDNWLAELSQPDVFDTSAATNALHNTSLAIGITNSTSLGTTSLTYSATSSPKQTTSGGGFDEFNIENATQLSQASKDDDDLQDLDPLGTGKSKPYVDKKYFFHEIKNPPKKVLKELTTNSSGATTSDTALQPESLVDMLEGNGISTPKAPLASSDSYESNQSNEVQPPQQASNTSTLQQQQSTATSDNTEDSSGLNSVMMARDTDPFSPTRKKSDPFQDGNDIFGKMDSTFQFEFEKAKEAAEEGVYNGPLQVSLPPETPPITTITSSSIYASQINRNKSGGIKQNTVDVISTISSKTMPHLFGQKFSKRDSPSINMRRLQESDSLSETEGAPEPPPRPDSIAQPPPLPPKKQFTDIIIRPRTTSISSSTSSTTVVIQPPPSSLSRYAEIISSRRPVDSSSTTSSGSGSAPPIPCPSRKVNRTDYNYPGPNRPKKPGCDEDNYLAPISSGNTLPTLLPPPQQSKGRMGRRYESYENRETNLSRSGSMKSAGSTSTLDDPIIPDITLSQLLTLGVDDLAKKLGVPASKLNTMTLVELTKYLAEYIEKSSRNSRISPHIQHQPKLNQHSSQIRSEPQPNIQQQQPPQTVQFKANFEDFDNAFQATFEAKFDDNFGEESALPFVANFSQLNEESSKPTHSTPVVPSADRYAVFREIIDLELQNCPNDPTSSDEGYPPQIGESQIEEEEQKIPKIDTKITEAISNAKDRYAALRDIILVEDLFEKPSTISHQVELEDDRDDSMHEKSLETGTGTAADDESSPEEAQDIMDEESGAITSIQTTMKDKFLTVTDDVEIDELMNRAISNLSLDSRDHLSPSNVAKSPQTISPNAVNQKTKSPINLTTIQVHTSQFSDVSTSPIPLQKLGGTVDEKIIPKSKSPIQSNIITSLRESTTPNKLTDGSLSDIVCNSSPDMEQQKQVIEDENESWACFDKQIEETEKEIKILEKQEQEQNKESPCSSDGPKDWKSNKRWPKGQTSSSSRDLSPWDDEGNEYKKRIPPNDRHGYYMRNSKRLNSCDDDYDYEEEMAMRRERKMKGMSRSRDNFDFDPPGWYSGSGHHSWSPQDYEEARARQFERGGYDRSTYGPPFYDKRDLKMPSHAFYDRRGYDKRKFYRDREYSGRTPTSNYDFESYSESYDKMSTKGRRDYENVYDEDFRGYGKSRPDYFYEGKSFDRESNESFESAGRRRRSFGSGDVYGSLESREDFRDRYTGEKARSLRKGMKFRSGASCEFEQDSENEVHIGRRAPISLDSRSLQRPVSGSRIRKSSGSSPWDVAEGDGHNSKNWKRPGSATETERRRNLGQTPTGSDGEKDKRFRKKQRYRSKDSSETRQARSHRDDYDDYMECEDYQQPIDEDKFERLNRRKHEMHQRMGEVDRRKKVNKYKYEDEEDDIDEDYDDPPISRKDNSDYYLDKHRYSSQQKFDAFDFDAYNDSGIPSKPPTNTMRSSSSKFSYQEQGGFESDFNSSPPSQPTSQQPTAPSTAASTKSSFRFSNDFSSLEKDRGNFENSTGPKLRFDDKVIISKFENDQKFEDDFSKNSEFEQTKNINRSNSKFSKQEIKKSESVNIFAKKVDDPFEDDDFFNSSATPTTTPSQAAVTFSSSELGNGSRRRPSMNKSNVSMIQEEQHWEDNFAKFDENM